MGGKIFSLRMARGMTQEQLAAVLCVSAAAVSKWERGISNPSVEILWAMADFFGCTIDEIVGRSGQQLEQLGSYDRAKARLAEVAGDLMRCCETARQQGFLALETVADGLPEREPGRTPFLAFAIRFFLKHFYQQTPTETIFELLQNYAGTLPAQEQAEGRMVTEALQLIISGEGPEFLREVIASYVGVEYREKLEQMDKYWGMGRDELLAAILPKYENKPQYSGATGLLNGFLEVGDFELQTIMRNLDNVTFVRAMCGAPGEIVLRFMRNLSNRLLVALSEDIDNFDGTERDILEAQQRVLEVGAFVFVK